MARPPHQVDHRQDRNLQHDQQEENGPVLMHAGILDSRQVRRQDQSEWPSPAFGCGLPGPDAIETERPCLKDRHMTLFDPDFRFSRCEQRR